MLGSETCSDLFRKIPPGMQRKISRYVRWQDRQSRLFGHLLLRECLELCGYRPDSTDKITYNRFGRPYLSHKIDFNISHSGSYVICAITDQGRVGIDIEKIEPLNLERFMQYMNQEEWSDIENSDHPVETFFEYWTQKESVLKANGRGLSIPIKDILIKDKEAILYCNRYFLNELNLDVSYKCHVATDLENAEMNIRQIDLGKIG